MFGYRAKEVIGKPVMISRRTDTMEGLCDSARMGA
jgi:hypothetical protein